MITLPTGERFEFTCASGALGLDGRDRGNGIIRLWKAPFRWLGILDPSKFVIITKTLTFNPRHGNLRKLTPWRCVRSLGGGNWVNAVGLTNPGYQAWIDTVKKHRLCYRTIVSIKANTEWEAMAMVDKINSISWEDCAMLPGTKQKAIIGIEFNISCPNVDHDFDRMCYAIQNVKGMWALPIIIKLGHRPEEIAKAHELLDDCVAAYDLINTVPFGTVYPETKSPLAKYGYGLDGGVSGPAIRPFAKAALTQLRPMTIKPIISGGGIADSIDEILRRRRLGANAFSLGVDFLRPWAPNRLITSYERRVSAEAADARAFGG